MKNFILNCKSKLALLICYLSDYRYMIKNYLTFGSEPDKILARIMLMMHALEKGMSFTDCPKEFGKEKSQSLVKLIRRYLKKNPMNEICRLSINILARYMENSNSTKDVPCRRMITNLLTEYGTSVNFSYKGGVKTVCEPEPFNEEVITYFFASRSSVRDYSDAPISDEEIVKALSLASFTPSACNRQASRTHLFRDKKDMRMIIDNQLGDQNWCGNAKAIMVVTVNSSYFGGNYERYQPFIDGGLYAMNVVHGLHLQHIASCFKMYVRSPQKDNEFRKITGIPQNEIPIVLILMGHYQQKPVYSPKSERICSWQQPNVTNISNGNQYIENYQE
ncbi:MAG: nitroreductase family protein [Prevotella sp.]|nr:nitroreductase family protein [Prevotella sp.]